MALFFITGTDTDIGKTVFTGCFCKFLQDQNRTVVPQKWVQTGYVEGEEDLQTHLEYMNKVRAQFESYYEYMMPYRFPLAASAHLAAENAGEEIDINRLILSTRKLETHFDAVVVEGLGGILVPLTQQFTSLDVVSRLSCTTIVVVENKVGAINHALLTIQALAERQVSVLGFVMNHKDSSVNQTVLDDNPLVIEQFSGVRCLGGVNLYKQFEPSVYFMENISNKIPVRFVSTFNIFFNCF